MTQPDLFGDHARAEAAKEAGRKGREEYGRAILGPTVPAPWDCQSGPRKGDPMQTYRCPACALLELSEYGLFINHGASYDDAPWCSRVPAGGYRVRADGTLGERTDLEEQ